MPKITVVVPVYNAEKYLERCLESIMRQSFQDFELICINDCSSDSSQKILECYGKNYPDKVKVLVNEINLGPGKTKKRGLLQAHGRYVMFVDSDDYIKEDYLETYFACMEKTDVDIVIGGYVRDIDGKLKEHKVSESVWSLVTYPTAWAKMFKKDFLIDNHVETSDIRYVEDIYFSMSVYYHNTSYVVMDYAGYYYYLNPKSITGSMNYEKGHERFVADVFREFMQKYDLQKLSEEKRRVIEYTYIANMINALITYGHGGGVRRMREKYSFWMKDMMDKFPDYRNNPFVGICKPSGQTVKIRLSVGIIMGLKKVHLDKLLLYIISLI